MEQNSETHSLVQHEWEILHLLRDDYEDETLSLVSEKISNQVAEFSDLQFNSVLLNRFRNGSDKIGWHSDNEKCLGETINIATISLGAERHLFTKRLGDKKSVELNLGHRSLLLMKHPFQQKWLHCIPPRKHQNGERISLTFRTIVTAQGST